MKWRVAAAPPPPRSSRGKVVQLFQQTFLENTFLSNVPSAICLGEDLLHTGLNVCLHHESRSPVHSLIFKPFQRTSQGWVKSPSDFFSGNLYNHFLCGFRGKTKRILHLSRFFFFYYGRERGEGQIAAIWPMLALTLCDDHQNSHSSCMRTHLVSSNWVFSCFHHFYFVFLWAFPCLCACNCWEVAD